MSALRLSRYGPDHFYYEIWANGAVVVTSGQPECGDFSSADLLDFIETYVDITLVLICPPDMMERKSDTRTLATAAPNDAELAMMGCDTDVPIIVAVEEYYHGLVRD